MRYETVTDLYTFRNGEASPTAIGMLLETQLRAKVTVGAGNGHVALPVRDWRGTA